MKKHIILLLTLLLLVSLTASAGAETSKQALIERYLGAWVNDDYELYIRLEDDEIYARLTETDGSYVWEFDRCYYDAEDDRLWAPCCTRYKQVLNWDTMEIDQEDWSLNDMAFTYFYLKKDEVSLKAIDVPHIKNAQTLRWVSDEEFFND